MANPNIRNMTGLYGNTALASVTASYASFVANASSSGTLVKITNLTFANIVSSAVTVSVRIVRSSTNFVLINAVSVPANSSFAVFGKDAPIYLNEGDDLQIVASATSSVQAVCSYEVIS